MGNGIDFRKLALDLRGQLTTAQSELAVLNEHIELLTADLAWSENDSRDQSKELAALREELATSNKVGTAIGETLGRVTAERDDLHKRLTAAEQRNAVLEAELEVEKINAAHWKSTIAGEGQISKEARRYRGIRDILPLNELIEATADCQSSAEWDNAVDAALNPTESGASE